MKRNEDFLITALSKTGKVVGYFASVKNTVQEAQHSHGLNVVSTAVYARALCSTVLLGGNLKNREDLLTVTWDCTGPAGRINIETDYQGNVRGFITEPALDFIEGSISLDDGFRTEPYIQFGELVVTRKSYAGAPPYTSVVVLETGEIAQDISLYLDQSLQVQSVINVGLSITQSAMIEICGGVMLMGLPGVTETEIKTMYEAYEKLGSLSALLADETADIEHIFQRLDMDLINKKSVQFKCRCTMDKIIGTLQSIQPEKRMEFLSDAGNYEVRCHHCGKNYIVTEKMLEHADE